MSPGAWILGGAGLIYLGFILATLGQIRDELCLLRQQEWKTTDELKKIKQLEKTR